MTDIAATLKRVEKVLLRSPKTGLHVDARATARWSGGTRVTTTHENGAQVATDMPVEMGGEGSAPTPGWLLRAGLASCVTTRIVMAAAVEGIELSSLEVVASSRSDARGALGMTDTNGAPIAAGPIDVVLDVRVAACDGTSGERLRSLVERCHDTSPVSCAVQNATPIELRVAIG